MNARVNWGTGIAVTYGLFAIATLGFVAFAMRQPVSLVSPTYYEDALREDAVLAAMRNAAPIAGDAVTVDAAHRVIRIALPDGQEDAAGTITFYRASDPAADRTVRLAPDAAGRQVVPASDLQAGAWVVQVRWTAHGRPYYVERPFRLQ
jgi:hypothetical protein